MEALHKNYLNLTLKFHNKNSLLALKGLRKRKGRKARRLIHECLTKIPFVRVQHLNLMESTETNAEALKTQKVEISEDPENKSELPGDFLLITDVRGGAVDVYSNHTNIDEEESSENLSVKGYKMTDVDVNNKGLTQFMHLVDAIEDMDVQNHSADGSTEDSYADIVGVSKDMTKERESAAIVKDVVKRRYSLCSHAPIGNWPRSNRKRPKSAEVVVEEVDQKIQHDMFKIMRNLRKEFGQEDTTRKNSASETAEPLGSSCPSAIANQRTGHTPKERCKLMQRHLMFEDYLNSQKPNDSKASPGNKQHNVPFHFLWMFHRFHLDILK